MNRILFATMALAAGVSYGAVTIEKGTTFTRPTSKTYPQSTSGITYAGGNTFYAVADDRGDLANCEGGLYKYTISLSSDGKTVSVTSPKTNEVVKLANGYDQEGCAYDPATGYVWVSDEVRKSIRAFDPATGVLKSTLAYPAILNNAVGNFAVEGLTISGDGLTMWFANEEGLTCDGGRSAYGKTTTCRLFKFTRKSVTAPFEPAGQFPYTADSWKYQYDYSSKARHGIAGLCALPDGSLLVLERDLSFSSASAWDIFWNDKSWLGWTIYLVQNPEWATDVTAKASLTEDTSWTAVSKTSLASEGTDLFSYGNFEGICLGPRLANGNTSVLLISDAGDGYSKPMVKPLVLSGLDIRTLDFAAPASGDVPSVVGTNYRYLNGAQVNVTLSGEGLEPVAYTNNGSRVATASWSLATSGRQGAGTTAAFTVNGDDKLTWTVNSTTAVTPVVAHDTFEEFEPSTASETIAGWSENGTVVEESYAPPAVGCPMQRTTHTKVLSVDDQISREYASKESSKQQLDMMVKVVRPASDSFPSSGYQGGVVMAADGRFRVCHAASDGSPTNSVASQTVFANGDWVRVTMSFDYTATKPLFSLRLNGAWCGEYPVVGANRRVAGFDVSGATALDDVLFTDGEPDAEVATDPSKPSTVPAGVKVPSGWFDRYGLAWNDTESDGDGDELINWKEYLAGTSPLDAESVFEIMHFEVKGNAVEIAFSGELPRPDLLRLKWCEVLGGDEKTISGEVTSEGGVSVWRATAPAEAHFFRAYIGD